MNYRFFKQVSNQDGQEVLSFFLHDKPDVPLITYNLDVLRQFREDQGELAVAKSIHTVLSVILKSPVSSEEIEYAVEDI